ncbi:MAG: LysE family transporter, partial [Gammaproteobacteria bacterium]|nr:LysE family transporter [Gammaproteobacteria bacterium]
PIEVHEGGGGTWQSGFLVAFLNPKVALFFIALFSQFINPESSVTDKVIVTLTAGCIDAVWYISVALMLSHGRWLNSLKKNALIFDRIYGVLLIGIAVRVVAG